MHAFQQEAFGTVLIYVWVSRGRQRPCFTDPVNGTVVDEGYVAVPLSTEASLVSTAVLA